VKGTIMPRVADIVARRDAVIEQEEKRFKEAARYLLAWRSRTPWIPDSQAGYTAIVDEGPQPIGPDVDAILNGLLPEHIAAKRITLLSAHANEVLRLRDLHRAVWEGMLGREVRVMVMDGLAPRTAEAAARANLAVRKQELDAELEEGLQRLSGELQRRPQRMLEDAEDDAPDPVRIGGPANDSAIRCRVRALTLD
jgi:hypothetical protein